jgi:hypothetical protein
LAVRKKREAELQAYRVQALACVFGHRQPKGCTLNARMYRTSVSSAQFLELQRKGNPNGKAGTRELSDRR